MIAKVWIILFTAVLTFTSCDSSSPYNSGIVVRNKYYEIYRSSKLGINGLDAVFKIIKMDGYRTPKTIIHMNKTGYHSNSYALQEYEMQNEKEYKFYHSYSYDYRTYLDGKNPLNPKKDIDKKKYIGKKARDIFGFREDDKVDGGLDAFKRIMDLILDPANQPVLFHCHGGRHRTGMIALAIRYIQGGEWTRPILNSRFKNKAQEEYYKYNSLLVREENLEFIEKVSKMDFFKEYIYRYRDLLNI